MTTCALAGIGLVRIGKLRLDEVPFAFVNVSTAVPVTATSAAVMAAVSSVGLFTVVIRGLPFHCSTVPLMKLVPTTLTVNALAPTTEWFGVTTSSVGGPG